MNTTIPLSLDERTVERYIARDPNTKALVQDAEMQAMAGALRTARDHAERIANLATTLGNDPTRTKEAAALTLKQNAIAIAEKATLAIDTARARALAAIERIETETKAPPPPRDAHAVMLDTEIRQSLARMSDDDRAKAVARAFDENDDTVIGAVLRGPAMLSGMPQSIHGMTRHRWRAAKFPNEVDRVERLRKAVEAVDRGGNSLIKYVDDIANSPAVKMTEAAARHAEQALLAVNNAK